MAQHHRVDGLQLGRPAGGGEDPGHVLEVGAAERARGRDRQKRHVVLAGDEAVDLAAANADRLAGPDVDGLTVDREGDRSLDPVDRLLEGVVAVGEGNRMPLEVVQARTLAALHERGFDDLVPAHLVVLRYPGPQGRRPGEIAAGSGHTKQATNYLLGQLERLGYLERGDDPDDGRSRRVYLTPRGVEAAMVLRETVAEVEREWAGQLGAEDFEQLRSLLSRLVGILPQR